MDISQADDGVIKSIRASDEHPLWPKSTERRIAALARQIHALPHLRARHLVRLGRQGERTTFLLLPQTGTSDK
ncbi:hypothetical protein [Streptomyces sp. NPDC001975]